MNHVTYSGKSVILNFNDTLPLYTNNTFGENSNS